eukprot:g8217.t1
MWAFTVVSPVGFLVSCVAIVLVGNVLGFLLGTNFVYDFAAFLSTSYQNAANGGNGRANAQSADSLLMTGPGGYKLWRKLRKRRLKKLRESQDGEEGEGDEKLENSAEKADLLIQEYGIEAMADELEGVIRVLSEEQRRELVSQYWDSEYGVRACPQCGSAVAIRFHGNGCTTASARSEQSQCAAFVFAKNLTQHVSSVVTRDLLVDAVLAQRALRGKSVSTGTSSNVGKDSKGGLLCSPSSGWGNFFGAADTAAGGGHVGAGGRFGGSIESEEDQRQAILDGLKTAPGEYFIPIPQNESMAHVKLVARKVLRENGFGAHECDAILYRNQFQHLKGVAIKSRLFSPERVQELRTM